MPVDTTALLADLRAESDVTESLLAPLGPADWDRPTPAQGWSIRDQVTHLAYFDQAATLALLDPERFQIEAADVIAIGAAFPDQIAEGYRRMPAADALIWFGSARATLLEAFAAADPAQRVPWYGPPMSLATSITARLMETWAHSQDIADALGVTRPATSRLRHIAHLGVTTMAFTHILHGLPAPDAPIRVELAGPDGHRWTWGTDDAADQVAGSALDFCLVVTQRRAPADTGLRVTGDAARTWLAIAQAFAGQPTTTPPSRRHVGAAAASAPEAAAGPEAAIRQEAGR